MISSISASGESDFSKRTEPKRLAARIATESGVLTSTAPNVPPSTMMAAVYCEMSEILPFSSSSPPIMPPSASTIPPSVAKSGFDDDFPPALALLLATSLLCCAFRTRSLPSRRNPQRHPQRGGTTRAPPIHKEAGPHTPVCGNPPLGQQLHPAIPTREASGR